MLSSWYSSYFMVNYGINYSRSFSFYAMDHAALIVLKKNYYSKFSTKKKSKIIR